MLITLLGLLSLFGQTAFASPITPSVSPTVKLDNGTFVGISTNGLTNSFLGIPFGKAPIGDLRLNLPVLFEPYTGTHLATAYGPACPHQNFIPRTNVALFDEIVEQIYGVADPGSEDCLSVNVVVPAGVNLKSAAKLPVAIWIYGGGFQILGSTRTYQGDSVVARSIEIGEPIVYVSMNYRISAYGFLASKEVKDAGVGNLGLHDQRLAFRWVQKYISAFGGDPSRVTIWGNSAGAISVATHMIANGGDTQGLFHGAFMQSGSPVPVGDLTNGQADYDDLVRRTGCSSADDTLHCLRHVPFEKLRKAVDMSPVFTSNKSLHLTWMPRADGTFLSDDFLKLVQDGSVADIPFVTGDCDDEGTLFSFLSGDVQTEGQFRDYIVNNYMPAIDPRDSRLERLFALYPSDPRQGSPFGTGDLNALTPQFKRLAAIQGDLVFQAPRRFLLEHRAHLQSAWAFLYKRNKAVPFYGSGHSSDVSNVYGGGELADYLVRFANHLDPNGPSSSSSSAAAANAKGPSPAVSWPRYTRGARAILSLGYGAETVVVAKDDYRVEGMQLLTELSLQFPI